MGTKGLWVYMFITFIQMFLIIIQACLAAILNLEPYWAKITVALDIAACLLLLLFSQEILFGSSGMFPLSAFPWIFTAPVKLLQWYLWDREVVERLGQILVAEAPRTSTSAEPEEEEDKECV